MENNKIKLWWYDPPKVSKHPYETSVPSGRNAGDYYGKWLLEKIGYQCEFSKNPDIITCGSILAITQWTGDPYVWGSGFHNKTDALKKLSHICAVRGKLSYGKLNTKKKIAVGDPGLLASRFYTPITERKYEFGFIPHYVDYDECVKKYGKTGIPIIDMRTDDIPGLLDQINECRFIFSSSLHGIIFSHSLGIPAIHVENKELFSKDNFKFKDYYSVFDSVKYVKEKWSNVKYSKYTHADPNLYRPSNEELRKVQDSLLNSFPFNIKVAICAVAKCENDYINDWVKWHIDRGVDDIYLWDNNDRDYEPVEYRIDKEYLDRVHITKIPGAKEFQIPTYNKFYNDYKDEYDWIGFFDLDEYVVPKQWLNIKAFLSDNKFADYNVIKMNWHLYGDDDKPYRDISVPVWQGLTKRLKNHEFESHCKQFVRGKLDDKVEICSNHWCKINGELPKQVMPDGKPTSCKISGARNCEEAYINHYMTKTLGEFINQKMKRGTDASFKDRTIDLEYFWRVNKKSQKKLDYLNRIESSEGVGDYDYTLLSVIIPVYNRPQRVVKALNSIPKRDDIEIIVIDDCSTDNTLEALNSYNNNVRPITILQNEVNSGPGISRNKGLDIAKGEYIAFLDSDDWFLTSNLNNALIKLDFKYDIIWFENNRYSNGSIWSSNTKRTVSQGHLIKRSLIGKTRFPDSRWGEDKVFFAEVKAKAKDTKAYKFGIYVYDFRPGSTTKKEDTLTYKFLSNNNWSYRVGKKGDNKNTAPISTEVNTFVKRPEKSYRKYIKEIRTFL